MAKMQKIVSLDAETHAFASKLPNFSEWVREKLLSEMKIPPKTSVAEANIRKWDNAVQELGPLVKRWGEIREASPTIAKEIYMASRNTFHHSTLPFSLDARQIRFCIGKYEEIFPPSPIPSPPEDVKE